MSLRGRIPDPHLSDDSKHAIERGLAIIGTIAGVVLGLLVGAATASYNTQRGYVVQISAEVGLLDRALAHYGPQGGDARKTLRRTANDVLVEIWPQRSNGSGSLAPGIARNEAIFDEIEKLVPGSPEQTSIKQIAIGIVLDIARTRWLMYEQLAATISIPLLVILLFWFCVTFAGLGLFAPRNATTIVGLTLCAVAIAGAMYIMMAMYAPFSGGLLEISSRPLEEAIARLGR